MSAAYTKTQSQQKTVNPSAHFAQPLLLALICAAVGCDSSLSQHLPTQSTNKWDFYDPSPPHTNTRGQMSDLLLLSYLPPPAPLLNLTSGAAEFEHDSGWNISALTVGVHGGWVRFDATALLSTSTIFSGGPHSGACSEFSWTVLSSWSVTCARSEHHSQPSPTLVTHNMSLRFSWQGQLCSGSSPPGCQASAFLHSGSSVGSVYPLACGTVAHGVEGVSENSSHQGLPQYLGEHAGNQSHVVHIVAHTHLANLLWPSFGRPQNCSIAAAAGSPGTSGGAASTSDALSFEDATTLTAVSAGFQGPVMPPSVVHLFGDGGQDTVSVTLGRHVACLVTVGGTMYCWGGYLSGGAPLLGVGAAQGSDVPLRVGTHLQNWWKVSTFHIHACALDLAGQSWCWGDNSLSQLGVGSSSGSYSTPVRTGGARVFSDISAGFQFTCAIDLDSAVWCWGDGSSYKMGNGLTSERAAPGPVSYLGGNPVIVHQLSAGRLAVCGVTLAAQLVCWGTLPMNAHPWPTLELSIHVFVSVHCGEYFCCALTADGLVLCWGEGAMCRLGFSSSVDVSSPTQITSSHQGSFVSLETGWAHACATTSAGEVICWGYGLNGQTGPLRSSCTVPQTVSTTVTPGDTLLLGLYSSAVVQTDGSMLLWGDTANGVAIGASRAVDATSPFHFPLPDWCFQPSPTVKVISGITAACILSSKGLLCNHLFGLSFATGYAYIGDLSDNRVVPRSISIGKEHACMINDLQRVECWGLLNDHRLGRDYQYFSISGNLPVPDGHATATDSVAVSVGEKHSCDVSADGAARCWGDNSRGQVGTICGSLPQSSTISVLHPACTRPYVVHIGGNVTAISAGHWHTCSITDSAVSCWGLGGSGQLGTGTVDKQPRPVIVAALQWVRIASVSAGESHTCALAVSGTAWCWGRGTEGQLGDGHSLTSSLPVLVQSPARFVEVSVGQYHSCALSDRGVLYCWGSSSHGQRGDGTLSSRTLPVQVLAGIPGVSYVSSFSTGYLHTCINLQTAARQEILCFGEGSERALHLPQTLPGARRTFPVSMFGGAIVPFANLTVIPPSLVQGCPQLTGHNCTFTRASASGDFTLGPVNWAWGLGTDSTALSRRVALAGPAPTGHQFTPPMMSSSFKWPCPWQRDVLPVWASMAPFSTPLCQTASTDAMQVAALHDAAGFTSNRFDSPQAEFFVGLAERVQHALESFKLSSDSPHLRVVWRTLMGAPPAPFWVPRGATDTQTELGFSYSAGRTFATLAIQDTYTGAWGGAVAPRPHNGQLVVEAGFPPGWDGQSDVRICVVNTHPVPPTPVAIREFDVAADGQVQTPLATATASNTVEVCLLKFSAPGPRIISVQPSTGFHIPPSGGPIVLALNMSISRAQSNNVSVWVGSEEHLSQILMPNSTETCIDSSATGVANSASLNSTDPAKNYSSECSASSSVNGTAAAGSSSPGSRCKQLPTINTTALPACCLMANSTTPGQNASALSSAELPQTPAARSNDSSTINANNTHGVCQCETPAGHNNTNLNQTTVVCSPSGNASAVAAAVCSGVEVTGHHISCTAPGGGGSAFALVRVGKHFSDLFEVFYEEISISSVSPTHVARHLASSSDTVDFQIFGSRLGLLKDTSRSRGHLQGTVGLARCAHVTVLDDIVALCEGVQHRDLFPVGPLLAPGAARRLAVRDDSPAYTLPVVISSNGTSHVTLESAVWIQGAMQISSVEPLTVPVDGGEVTVHGLGFGDFNVAGSVPSSPMQSQLSVWVGPHARECTSVVVVRKGTLRCQVGPGIGSLSPVQVTRYGGVSSFLEAPIQYAGPQIRSISPQHILFSTVDNDACTAFEMHGANFGSSSVQQDFSITIGGANCEGVVFTAPDKLSCSCIHSSQVKPLTLPTASIDVKLQGRSATVERGVAVDVVDLPELSYTVPTRSAIAGDIPFTLHGNFFTAQNTPDRHDIVNITVGDALCKDIRDVSSAAVTCTLPHGDDASSTATDDASEADTASFPVMMTFRSGESTSLPGAMTYVLPRIVLVRGGDLFTATATAEKNSTRLELAGNELGNAKQIPRRMFINATLAEPKPARCVLDTGMVCTIECLDLTIGDANSIVCERFDLTQLQRFMSPGESVAAHVSLLLASDNVPIDSIGGTIRLQGPTTLNAELVPSRASAGNPVNVQGKCFGFSVEDVTNVIVGGVVVPRTDWSWTGAGAIAINSMPSPKTQTYEDSQFVNVTVTTRYGMAATSTSAFSWTVPSEAPVTKPMAPCTFRDQSGEAHLALVWPKDGDVVTRVSTQEAWVVKTRSLTGDVSRDLEGALYRDPLANNKLTYVPVGTADVRELPSTEALTGDIKSFCHHTLAAFDETVHVLVDITVRVAGQRVSNRPLLFSAAANTGQGDSKLSGPFSDWGPVLFARCQSARGSEEEYLSTEHMGSGNWEDVICRDCPEGAQCRGLPQVAVTNLFGWQVAEWDPVGLTYAECFREASCPARSPIPAPKAMLHDVTLGYRTALPAAFVDTAGTWSVDGRSGNATSILQPQNSSLLSPGFTFPEVCDIGHGGHLCGRCQPGFARAPGNLCRPCAERGVQWLSLLGGLAVGTLLLGYLIRTTIMGTRDKALRTAQGETGAEIKVYVALNKLIFSHLQQIAIAASFPMKWPAMLLRMYSVFDSSASVSQDLISVDCFEWNQSAFVAGSATQLLLPAFIFVVLTVGWGGWGTHLRCSQKQPQQQLGQTTLPNKMSKVNPLRRAATARAGIGGRLFSQRKTRESRTGASQRPGAAPPVQAASRRKSMRNLLSLQPALATRIELAAVAMEEKGTTRTAAKPQSSFNAALPGHADLHMSHASIMANTAMKSNRLAGSGLHHKRRGSTLLVLSSARARERRGTTQVTERRQRTEEARQLMQGNKVPVGAFTGFIVSCLVSAFVLHLTLTKTALALLSCTQLAEGQWYLLGDLDIACEGSTWTLLAGTGSLGLVVYGLGIPMGGLALLFVNRHHLHEPHIRARYGFLYMQYNDHMWFWETVTLLRKVGLAVIAVLLATQGTGVQVTASIALLVTCLVGHFFAMPHRLAVLNNVEAISLTVAVATLSGGAILVDEAASDIWKISTSFVLVVLNGTFLVWVMGLLLKAVVMDGSFQKNVRWVARLLHKTGVTGATRLRAATRSARRIKNGRGSKPAAAAAAMTCVVTTNNPSLKKKAPPAVLSVATAQHSGGSLNSSPGNVRQAGAGGPPPGAGLTSAGSCNSLPPHSNGLTSVGSSHSMGLESNVSSIGSLFSVSSSDADDPISVAPSGDIDAAGIGAAKQPPLKSNWLRRVGLFGRGAAAAGGSDSKR